MDLDAFRPAAALHAEGRLEEAEAAYRALLTGDAAQSAMAHRLLGMVCADRGDLEGALAEYGCALTLGEADASLLFSQATTLRSLGRMAQALDSYAAAASLTPDFAEAHHMAGVCLAALGRLYEAIDRYREATRLSPDEKRAWNNLGVALEAQGRLVEALDSYGRAIALDPDYVQAQHNRGSTLLKRGRWLEALGSFDAVVARLSDIPETWNMRAVVLAHLDRHAEALQSAERALRLRPGYAEAYNNSSVALRALKLYEQALDAADAALAARPGFIEALNSRGSALAKLNQFDEAQKSYRLALDAAPENPAILLNLGLALEALGELSAAEDVLATAQALSPGTPDAPFARGLVRIRSGDIAGGFALYEHRWNQRGGPAQRHPKATLWLGETPLGDRRLLVHAEQGLGDTIQFCRFAAMAAPASRLGVQVQPGLKRLLSRLEGVTDVRDFDDPTPDFDVHIPMMSLPLALNLDVDGLSSRTPYLSTDPARVAAWRARAPKTGRLRVGLAWTGNVHHDNDHNRSITFASLRPLLAVGAEFVSLQKEYRPEDLAALDEAPEVKRFEADLHDFADTAALVETCDLVIAVDTSVAHLAGALGKPTWVLLPRFCDWRWMNDRPDTPWYPSVRLFRQTIYGAWAPVIETVAARLKAEARAA
jgi:tetratricopeptide (TPR) repeat protein